MSLRQAVAVTLSLICMVTALSATPRSGPDRPFTFELKTAVPPAPTLRALALATDGLGGVIVGDRGAILRTEDAGKSWRKPTIVHPSDAALTAVRYVSQARVVAVGDLAKIIYSEDSGKSWEAATSPAGLDAVLTALAFNSATSGVAVGDKGTILRTEDGGKSWSRAATPPNLEATLTDVAFGSSTTGLAVGNDGTILRSTDEGRSWKSVAPPNIATDFRALAYVDGNSAIVVGVRYRDQVLSEMAGPWRGATPTFLKTEDGGDKWIAVTPPPRMGFDLRAVTARPGKIQLAVGDRLIVWLSEDGSVRGSSVAGGGILFSKDGETWQIGSTFSFAQLYAVSSVGQTAGVAVGGGGYIYKTNDGKDWAAASRPSYFEHDLLAVSFYNETVGLAVGEGGGLLRTEDGGSVWNAVSTPSGFEADLHALSNVGPNVAVAIGDAGTILRTQDGGQTWAASTTPPGVDSRLQAISFADPTTGVAVGEGPILRTHDAGVHWERSKTVPPGISKLEAVTFVDGKTGVAVGATEPISTGGAILRTLDGGESWTQATLPINVGPLSAIAIVDKAKWIVVGDSGTVLRTRDAGQNWERVKLASPVASSLRAVAFANGATGVIIGEDGIVLQTKDGGENWRQPVLPPEMDTRLHAVAFASPNDVVVVGSNGTILQSDDGGDNWTKATVPNHMEASIVDVAFANATTGLAVGESGTVLSTRDNGKTWSRDAESDARDIERVALSKIVLAQDERGAVIIGQRGVRLAAVSTNYAPYLKNWESAVHQTIGNEIAVEVELTDDEGDPIKNVVAEYAVVGEQGPLTWKKLPKTLERSQHDGFWRASWSPQGEGIADGVVIRHRISINDGGPVLGALMLKDITYRTLWDRIWADHKTIALSVLGGLSLLAIYLLPIAAFFSIAPARLALAGIGDLDMGSLADGGLAWTKIPATLIRQLTIPWLKRHPRVRRAWLETYRRRETELAKLAKDVREDFLKRDDVLDAWVERRRSRAAEALEKTDIFAKRKIFVALSLHIGDQTDGRTITDPGPEDLRFVFLRDRAVVKILGLGGCGKTTLACALARWCLAQAPEECLLPFPAIPVVISSDTTDLLAATSAALKMMLGTEQELEPDVVAALLSKRRVVVIVDGLSERSPEMQQHLATLYGGDTPINALVVTSRLDFEVGPVDHVAIRPQPIDLKDLTAFIFEYLKRRGLTRNFEPEAQFEFAQHIVRIVKLGGGLAITPLLVTLFIDSLEGPREVGPALDLPRNVPEVYLEYLRRLNPVDPKAPNRIDHDVLRTAAFALAELSLQLDFVPKSFRRVDAVKVLDRQGLAAPSAIIDRLLLNGIFSSQDMAGVTLLQFQLDPIAEYMAAIAKCQSLGDSSKAWGNFMKELTEAPGYPLRCGGFLSAMSVCYASYRVSLALADVKLPWATN